MEWSVKSKWVFAFQQIVFVQERLVGLELTIIFYSLIILSINHSVYKMPENVEICPSGSPRVQGDVPEYLVLSAQQSKSQRL